MKWTDVKPYFTARNLLIGFWFGLILAGIGSILYGSITWPAVAILLICTLGAPLIKFRDDELAKLEGSY
jgi:TM2 domain-containing membrane protein YozV